MTTTTRGLVVLDPTVEAVGRPGTRLPRPTSLEGKTIGFIDNSKLNSDRILKFLDELLRERYGIAGSVHRRKPSASQIVSAELLDELVQSCDLVIPGVGD